MTSSMFIFEQVGEREKCYYQDLRSFGSLVKTGPIRGARYDLKWKYYAYYSFYIQWLNLFALAPVPMYLTRTSSISLEADPSWRLCPWLHNNNNIHILGWLSTTSMGRSNTWPSRKEARLDRDHKHNIQTFRAEYSDAAAAGSVSSSFQLFPIFSRSGCLTHFSGMKKKQSSMTLSSQIYTSASFRTATSSTASG